MSGWMLWSFVVLAGAVACQAEESIPRTDLEPAELVADLPWTFEVQSEPIEPRSAEETVRRGS